MADAYGSLPFAEAIQYLLGKTDLPTDRWDDLAGQLHDLQFMVAGATAAALLGDLHDAVTEAIASGGTLAEFRERFEEIVGRHGWTGWTGEDTEERRAWRARVIYLTNLRTSYAAGRLAQMRAIAEGRPWWRYRHNDTVRHPRELHVGWDGRILRHDDSWWSSRYPPNGWGCRCWVETLSDEELARKGLSPSDAPDDGTYEFVDRDGVPHTLPVGVEYGWDHQPGDLRALAEELRTGADALPGDLGDALRDYLARGADAA